MVYPEDQLLTLLTETSLTQGLFPRVLRVVKERAVALRGGLRTL